MAQFLLAETSHLQQVKAVRPALQVLCLVTSNIKHDSAPRFMSTCGGPDISGILSSTHHASVIVLSKQNLTVEWSWIKQPQFVELTETLRAAKTSLLSSTT